jgi:DNA-binding transcriptional MerR regulator
MSDKLRKAGTALTGLASVTTFYSLYLTLQDQSMKRMLEAYRSEKEALGNTIVNLSADNRLSELKRAEFLRNAEDSLARTKQILELMKQGKTQTATDLIKQEQVDWSSNVEDSLAELHKLVQEYKDSTSGSNSGSGSGSSSHFVDSFNSNLIEELQQLADSYWDWINSLSIMQQFAISHILAAVTVLLSMSSLITVFYSDYLIKRFNLESKFPRLAKYISLRRTFQQYYFFINSIVIIFFLSLVIVFNFYIFIIS